jgi:agmatinase
MSLVLGLDLGYITAMYGRRAVLEALTGMAQRKLGLPGPNYVHPVASGETPFPERGHDDQHANDRHPLDRR